MVLVDAAVQAARRPRLLVVVAHPDDESFGTGSVIAAAVASGAEVTICCATRGEAGEAPASLAGADLAEVREGELRTAAGILGVHRCVLLRFADSGMSGAPPPGALAAAPSNEVTAALRAVLDDISPDVVVTLDPEHGDGHRDHVAITRAAVAVCHEHPRVRLYAWGLRRPLLARWFTELARLRPDSGHLDLDRAGLGRPDAHITTVIPVAEFRSLREQAIAAHASQTSPYDGMPGDLRDEFLDTDSLVRLQPPWQAGPLETSLFPAVTASAATSTTAPQESAP
ncbi:MAG: PIG-L family deacetylase [Actinomycetota bacterium]|nr:PIG-L family deacetylase [Actinomycetota bacterium]